MLSIYQKGQPMKTQRIQSHSPIRFTGLIKSTKTVPANIMINPTKEALKESEARWQKQLEDLGLVVIKEVKLSIKQNLETPIKSFIKDIKKEN